MKEDKDEVRRLLGVLHTLMRMLGVSNREIERRLKLHPSSLTRLFNGQVEAKLELVLGIARALGLDYSELFAFSYPEGSAPEPSEAALRVRSLLEGLQPPKRRPAPPQPKDDDYSDVVRSVRELVERMKEGEETEAPKKTRRQG
jgi:transcriptional regulator with XRE-family HTH domain